MAEFEIKFSTELLYLEVSKNGLLVNVWVPLKERGSRRLVWMVNTMPQQLPQQETIIVDRSPLSFLQRAKENILRSKSWQWIHRKAA